MNEKQKVITKFLEWYESLTTREQYIFEGELGKIIKSLK